MLVLTGLTMSNKEVVAYHYSKLEFLEDGSLRLVKTDEQPK